MIRLPHPLTCALLSLVVLAACDPYQGGPSISPSPSISAGTAPETGEASPAVGQTDTGWGRIWDEVPEGFPLFPGGLPGGGTSQSVSAMLTYDGVEPGNVASWMQAELERAGFATEGLNGPLEDGSFLLDSTGAGGCRIQVQVAPTGSLVGLTVRYGAACPAP